MVVHRESGELESDEPIEQSSFEELNCSYSSPPTTYSPPRGPANFLYFPPSPPSSPLYSPASPLPPSSSTSSPLLARTTFTLFKDFQNQQHEDVVDLTVVDLELFVDYLIEDRGGELNVINGLEGGALNVINGFEDSVVYALEGTENFLWFDVNELEHQHEDIVDQLVVEYAGVYHEVIGYRGGELYKISKGGVLTMNGVEHRHGQALSTTPEPSFVFQDKLSVRVWLGHRGQWVVDIRHGWNWLNLGTFKTAEGAPLAAESVKRLRGGKDLFDYPRPFLIENGSEPLPLPSTAQEENQVDGIGSEGTGDCAMADQAQFNSACLKKRKTRKKNPEEEERNEKAKGVRIEIPLNDILLRKGMRIEDAANDLEVSKSTLKRICREYGINRWPPRKEQELISQSHPDKSPAVIDQEQIPRLNLDTLLPSNQVPATSDTYSVKVKGKKVFDMKGLKTTEPKESSKSKKRDSSLSALAESSKRKVDILKAKHNAKSTSVSVTSQDHGEPQGLLAVCIKTLNAMEDLDGASYMKAMKLLKDDPSWRPIFLDMSEQRKKDFVSYV